MSATTQSMANDKLYVLRFLAKIQSQHDLTIADLDKQIKALTAKKIQLQHQLQQIKLKFQHLQQQNKNIMARFECKSNLNEDSTQEKLQYLRQAPSKITNYLEIIQATPMRLKQNQERLKGPMTFAVWGLDKESIEKFENISPEITGKYLRKNQHRIKIMFIYNTGIEEKQ